MNAIAILDVGKTNKKLFLFDDNYRIIRERSEVLPLTKDEDGEPCEDLEALMEWVRSVMDDCRRDKEVRIRAVNFSAYGASFVHIDKEGETVAPLYDYCKPFPGELQEKFYGDNGGKEAVCLETASPALGSLNAGMQLYRIKECLPELFRRIHYSLHLPQFLQFLYTGKAYADITSIGCHTHLWDFTRDQYHEWVSREGVISKLPPLHAAAEVLSLLPGLGMEGVVAGTGLHDSSAAMIPYLRSFPDPFVLISTGTWCISLNPFNHQPLTIAELEKDCLCYMTYEGRPVKASRLFAGQEHEQQVRRLAAYFHKDLGYYAGVPFDGEIVEELRLRSGEGGNRDKESMVVGTGDSDGGLGRFSRRDLAQFNGYEEAYHRLLMDIMESQAASTRLVLSGTGVRRIFVDGGFSQNQVYMHLLAAAFPEMGVFAASVPQATALGAAMAIHPHWNKGPVPGNSIRLKYYG